MIFNHTINRPSWQVTPCIIPIAIHTKLNGSIETYNILDAFVIHMIFNWITVCIEMYRYIAIPEVSSGGRRYIPIGFLSPDIICSNKLQLIPDAGLYEFGILTSNVHMAWMRVVCGRLKSDYDYSAKIVHNNFPWPDPSDPQKANIEKTAQGILDARALYPDASLADLYDPLSMPPELRKAHQANDRAVMQAYGMPIKETDEAACVAWLMKLYQEKVNEAK